MSRAERWLLPSATSPSDFSAAPAGARDRDRSRRPARPGRLAATVLVVGLVLLGAPAAEAQTSRILVSNAAQTGEDSANTSGNDHAQLFHTGAHAAGYTLTGVIVNSDDAENDDFDVEICGADTTADEFPSGTCTALTAPASFSGNVVFTHTGLALSANTNYVVVIEQRGTGSVEIDSTTSSGEDASGLSGWSIKNKFYWKSGSTWMIKSGSNEALSIIVLGYARTAGDATDATLSALSVSGATLSPAFDAGTTSYHAVVANAVSQVTITETTSESTATVEYLDGSDATRTDADTMTAGLQVNLSVGSTIVKVKVTAPDTTTTQTYTVNILRVAVPVACSAASIPNRIWTGNLTVGTGTNEVGFSAFGGSLDNTNFSYKGTSYTIEFVTIPFGIALQIGLSAALGASTNDLVLHVGTEQYAFAEATFAPIETGYGWFSNFPSWADGDAVCLALTEVVDPAQTTPVLVSNIGQAENSTSAIFTYDHAQGFTTGSNSAGYTLTSIEVQIKTSGSIASAVVRKTDPNTGDLVAALTGPGTGETVGTGAQTFTAPSGTSLEPSTEYFVVFESGSSANSLTFSVTNADAEDASAAAGWSINDSGHFRNRTQTGNFTPFTGSKRIRVNGTINAITASCTVPTGGIWGACLTAATISTGSTIDASLPATGLGCITTSCGDTSVLTSRDFSFGGKNYRIETVDLRGGTLEFNLVTTSANTVAAEFSSVVLHVGTLSYSLATASFVGSSEAFAWTNTGLSWSANDKVALQLVELTSTNAPPAFSAATATRSVPENTAANTNIGTALPAATDADNDPLTYTLEGADAASFGFDPATRQLSTKSGETYDRETQSSYAVTLKADDGNGGTDTIAVTITLTNVIEPPGRPAAPTVTSVADSTTSLLVTWTAPSNTGPAIDNYKLQYRQGTSGSWINGPQNVSGTSATIGSLTTSTSYQVQVLATNAEGDSPWSLPGSGQTGALGAPDVPHSLDATPGNRQVMLSWVQPSGGAEVTHYEYELDLSGTWISTGSTDTDYTVRNLTNGQPYTFKVRAANSAGQSAASTASASVTPATVPGAPTGLGATVSDQRVDLIWTAPASNGGQSITDYEYEQGGSGTWISTGSTATSYMVHNLTNGQPYRFRVRAVNSVGAGAASAASPNVTPATEPDAPTGLSATVSDQEVDLIWTAPASNGGAPILRYEYELDFSGTWTSTGGTASSYTVTGLTNGQSYTFRVRALNRVGAGLASSSQSATPTSTVVAPDAPFGLSATPGNRQVMLSWVQPSGGAALTHYEYEQDGSGTWTSTGGTAPSHTVTGLTNGQSYTFRVRAVNSAGQSAASGSRTATPTTTAPEAPESLRFTPGDQQVTLRWRAPTNDGGSEITRYEYEQDRSGTWISTGGTATSHTVTGLNNGQTYTFRVRAVNALGNGAVVMLEATPSPSTGGGGGGGDVGPRQTWPGAPENLLAEGGDGQVKLTWEAPEDDGGSEITDYQYRINGRNPWTAIGSTQTTHTLTGLVNGTAYVFEVRAMNRIGRGRASNRAKATPEAPEVFTLDFAHFANGTGITSEMVLVNVAPHPIRPAIYFYDRGGHLIDPESVVDVTGDLEVTEDGSLSVLMEMEPLGQLTISTHGQGELVSGSVKVLSDGPIGGGVRYGLPEIGVAGVGASPPVRDALFPARRQEGGIRTATALHNLGAEAVGVRCRLMSGGVSLEEAEIPLEANGQASWFIEEAFPTTDTSDFLGSVRCTVLGSRRFTAIAVEMDAAERIFNTLSVVPVDRTGGGNKQTTLNFAHFANGTWITDLVFVNLSTEASRPAPSPFHTDILPSRPAIYFYDTEGNPIAAESVVDITGDLEITEDGALTVQTEMEPLGVLTISTHGRGELVTGSARVVSEGPIGGMLRFEHPDFGVAGVGASPPLSDALFPVRRQEGGITTGVALHNLESSPGLLRCDLMREGVLLDAASIPLEANGQTSWLIDQAFPAADTSDFAGSVRCDAVGEGLFSAVALEMDPGNRIFATLPVVPVPEMPDQE